MKKVFNDSLSFLSLGFVIVILWQMLLPGYVLTLDMVFAPKLNVFIMDGGFYNSLPIKYLFVGFNYFLSGWLVQKIMFIALFFCLFYLAVKFLPVVKKHYANYWAALFYAFNPFVYERFLAGHWTHLFAYAFLPPFFYYLSESFKDYSYKKLSYVLLWTLLIGVFSLHFLVMAVLIIAGSFLFKLVALIIKYTKNKALDEELFKVSKYALVFGILFLILSSYWLVPAFNSKSVSVLNTFNVNNQLAFKTVGNNGFETVFNVLTLYGFWGEREPWANYFLWPKDNIVFWSIALGFLIFIILAGIRYVYKNRKKESLFFMSICILAVILACGLGNSPFKGFNSWLFDNIGFWRGFRDTQKFSGLLVFVYAYFGGWGIMAIVEYFSQKSSKIYQSVLVVMFLVPAFYTYTMIGGFARQLQPVWYPQSWYQVKDVLDKDKGNYKALFLPWHQYFSLDFNKNIITANPAKNFFGDKIIQGDNMEVGGVFSQSQNPENMAIQDVILDDKKTPDEAVKMLLDRNIKYILVMNKLVSQDYLKYAILGSNGLEIVLKNGDLTIFEIKGYNILN